MKTETRIPAYEFAQALADWRRAQAAALAAVDESADLSPDWRDLADLTARPLHAHSGPQCPEAPTL